MAPNYSRSNSFIRGCQRSRRSHSARAIGEGADGFTRRSPKWCRIWQISTPHVESLLAPICTSFTKVKAKRRGLGVSDSRSNSHSAKRFAVLRSASPRFDRAYGGFVVHARHSASSAPEYQLISSEPPCPYTSRARAIAIERVKTTDSVLRARKSDALPTIFGRYWRHRWEINNCIRVVTRVGIPSANCKVIISHLGRNCAHTRELRERKSGKLELRGNRNLRRMLTKRE